MEIRLAHCIQVFYDASANNLMTNYEKLWGLGSLWLRMSLWLETDLHQRLWYSWTGSLSACRGNCYRGRYWMPSGELAFFILRWYKSSHKELIVDFFCFWVLETELRKYSPKFLQMSCWWTTPRKQLFAGSLSLIFFDFSWCWPLCWWAPPALICQFIYFVGRGIRLPRWEHIRFRSWCQTFLTILLREFFSCCQRF